MPQTTVKFSNRDGQQLIGIMDEPAGPIQAYALFAHCFTCSKNLKAVGHFARALNAAGVAVLRFDFTGLGQSEGEFADTNFSSNVDDLLAAVDFMNEHYEAPAILVGHSLGGTAVLKAAKDIPSAVAVATIGSPANPVHVSAMFDSEREEIESRGAACVQLGGRPFTVKKQFVDDLLAHDMAACLKNLRKALLIMHAPHDDIVEIENASEMFLHAKHPKSFVSLDNADHLLSREDDAVYAGQVLAAWATRYLPHVDQVDDDLHSRRNDTVARTYAGGFRTDIVSSGHAIVADEPVRVGGTDLGPSPYDLLSAALASCTTMTLQMYASRKGIDLTSATVRVDHQKIHAQDCDDCETKAGKVDEFRRELSLDGAMTDAQRQRMLEIADMCPVHRTLHNEVSIKTELVD